MNDKEQRIAIAEACGVPHGQWWCPTCKKWISGAEVTCEEKHDTLAGGCGALVSWYPDYPNDLNAMQSADPEGKSAKALCEILGITSWTSSVLTTQMVLKATSHQRAEAFLRTVGKWKDETK